MSFPSSGPPAAVGDGNFWGIETNEDEEDDDDDPSTENKSEALVLTIC